MSQIYGIDLSKEKLDIVYLNHQKRNVHKEINNTFKSIGKFLSTVPENAILVAEHTGVYGDLLVFLANQKNVKICLETGYKIRHSLGLLKGKTDKLDAQRIHEYGNRYKDKLVEVKCACEEMQELSELYSLRRQLVKERKILLCSKEKDNQSVFNSLVAYSIKKEMLSKFDGSISKIEKEITKIIFLHKEMKENYEIVTSIVGIGPVTTSELIIKTSNFKKIDTARKASSFAGVCPFPNASGKMVKKSKVSPMSDKELKTLLYMCAKSAVKHNKEYRLYYQKKQNEGKPHYLIMNNVSNKLLRTIYSLLKSKKEWDPNYICLDPREINKNVA